MDNAGTGAGDDQGSGWFQVKKKHRSSSKFSIRNWVEGSSRLQANGKGRNSDNKNQSDVSKPGNYCVQRSVAGQSSTSKEDGKDEGCLEKRVVAGDNGCVKTPPLKTIIAANSESTSVDNENLSHKKPDILHRIKWGDLEDDALAPTDGSSIVSEIRFGEIGDDDLAMCGTSRNLYDVSRCKLSKDCPVASKEIVEVVNVADDACNNMLDTHKDSLDENCKEVIEVSSTNVEKLSISSNVVDETSYDLDGKEVDSDHAEPLNKDLSCICDPSADEFPCSSAEGPAETGRVSGPVFKPALGGSGISSLRADDGDTEVIIAEDPAVLASSDRSIPEATGNSNSAAADSGCSATSKDSFPNAPLMKTVGDQVEGESKERFRERLWSFLFENLNRAIDELYLLCELECDMEQVQEAILVLQEAESDFRELNIRVEEFDKMKKNACQSTIGAVMSTKGDHRRPHALSWEVRRMTTSPHRAEILSSSLEAFKKIQEERAKQRAAVEAGVTDSQLRTCSFATVDVHSRPIISDASELESKSRRKSGFGDVTSKYRRDTDSGRSSRTLVQNSRLSPSTSSDQNPSKLPPRRYSGAPLGVKGSTERLGSLAGVERHSVSGEFVRRNSAASEKEKDRDRRNSQSWKPSDAWKEKRNWEEILASPCRLSSRHSYSPSMSRKSAERARILHDKLMSPEKKKKTALDLKKEAEEKHARAMRIRSELESERIQKLQRTSEKLNRVTERQAVRSMKLKEGMYARHQRSESRHEAHLANVAKRAGDESNKVNEVRFITSLNEETKKFLLRQKLHGSELRRAEKYQVFKTKQKEDMAREEAVMERRKLIEAEKLQRLAETQKRKEEAQLRREEERKASSAAREARAMEQLRRKEERAKAQQEESELLAQRLAERLRESEQRRKVYLEQIRERASMDFRDQSSPLLRRVVNKEGQGRTPPPKNADDNQETSLLGGMDTGSTNSATGTHQSLKRRIKKIRQRLMALKHDLPETSVTESAGIGYRTGMATARAKIGRWLQELQRLRQERKEGAASIGLIAAEMIKFLEGKELEQLAARRAGLLDFISSALPASHISKPEACQVTIYLLKLLKVVLFVPANRIYFLAQNLLPPLIPMLSAALESYIKIAASLNISGSSNSQLTKTSSERFDSISEVLDGFLCTVSMIIGLPTFDERQRQMQDGLLELVISYQIIHRLRDLFALYDRPQVEGSPFPSSILLSINLFVVLTSRPCPVSSIDWDCFLVSENKAEQSGLMKNFGCPVEDNSQDGLQLPSSAVNGHSSGISGAEQGDSPNNLHKTELVIDSKLSGEAIEVEQGYTPIDLNCNSKNTGVERLDSHRDLETSITNVNISLKEAKISSYTGVGRRNEQYVGLKQPHASILSAISETGLISLPSLLTAVLLQANSKSSEQGSYVLPSNFEEVATGVLKVLNNLALMDITFMQQMLARPDLKMEFFHTMSFLLTHCTNSWKVASDQVGLLLLESLLLLGYFSLFHPGNQAVLRWGSSPTILHKVCDLPFAFFSDPQLMPILGGTLVAACYGCERNKGVVQQELSTEMILSVVKASRSSLPRARSNSPTDKPLVEDSTLEPRKQQSEISVKPIRSTGRNSRLSMTKGGTTGSSINRVGKLRQPKDGKSSKISEDGTSKPKVDTTSEAPVTPPLYARFPGSFVERAEQFFSSELDSNIYNAHV